jgi:hypothetical protein
VHGTIFNHLEHFADEQLGSGAWAKMLKSAGLEGHVYSPDLTYDDAELVALVQRASSASRIPGDELLARFGEWLVPDLLSVYSYLIRPEWDVMDVLLNTEHMIHQAVRMGNPGAAPPRLNASRIGPNEVRIVYSSARKMCTLGEGIIRGLGLRYGTPAEVSQPNCMHRGDPYCVIVARTNPKRKS